MLALWNPSKLLCALSLVHFGLDLFCSESMHELQGLRSDGWFLLWSAGLADVYLGALSVGFEEHIDMVEAGLVHRTTGTSKSYMSFQPLASGLTMSTSLNTKGLVSHTSESTERAETQRPQCSLVKRVILQDCRSLFVTRISTVDAESQVSLWVGTFGGGGGRARSHCGWVRRKASCCV